MRTNYRLKSITRETFTRKCDLCQRRHHVVVTFEEVKFFIPLGDETRPVQVTPGEKRLVVGLKCAYKVLQDTPVAYYASALTRLNEASGKTSN